MSQTTHFSLTSALIALMIFTSGCATTQPGDDYLVKEHFDANPQQFKPQFSGHCSIPR